MRPIREKQIVAEFVDLLAELLAAEYQSVRVEPRGADCLVTTPNHRFVVQCKASGSAGSVSAAVEQLKQRPGTHKSREIPLVVVPFMGEVGQSICDKSRISWLDLSGNARIDGPGLRIWVEGRPNRFLGRGRPPNVFAPKSSRISRQLLLTPAEFQAQTELARKTGLDDGYVSKIVRRLQHENFLVEDKDGRVRPRDPNLFLDAWRSEYDFDRHHILKGHVPARSGDQLLQKLAAELRRQKADYAATGLGAAWLSTHFASFRIGTFYLRSMPSKSLLEAIEFRDEPTGANTWLVIPNDDGVFQGREIENGINCVSAVQTYLDLKDHPERSKEAADELRKQRLNWNINGQEADNEISIRSGSRRARPRDKSVHRDETR